MNSFSKEFETSSEISNAFDVLFLSGGSDRRLLQRSDELLDEDFEFFQNLQILQEEQVKKIHAAFRRKL